MKRKIAAVQELRGIAAIYVVLFHVGTIFKLPFFLHGSAGVSMFFIISGFIIALIHNQDKGFDSAILFIKKRVARIYFPYFLPFAIMLALFFITGKGSEYHRDTFNIVRNFLLVQNPSFSIHPYAWSLVYEIYYYATFCFLVIAFRMNIIAYSIAMIAPLVAGMILPGLATYSGTVPMSFYNLYFVSGILTGYYFKRIDIKTNSMYTALALVAYLAIPFLTENAVIVLVSTVVLFLLYSKSNFSLPFMKQAGDASYSIYLVHAVVLSVLKNMFDDRSLILFFVFLFLSIGTGFVYHTKVEKPLVAYLYGRMNVKRKLAGA